LSFFNPFTFSFRLFNGARSPVTLKKVVIVPAEQYVLVTTFDYHLPVGCTLVELTAIPSSGIEFEDVPFGLPLSLSINEAFTAACFLRTGFSAEPKALGRYEIKYSLGDSPDAVSFGVPMPKVDFLPKKCEATVTRPETLVVNAPTSLHIAVTGFVEGGLACELVVGETFSFRLQCEPRRAVTVPQNTEIDLEIPFVPIQPGKQVFPALALVEGGVQLWSSCLTFIVKTE
jgi:hypothetical protein